MLTESDRRGYYSESPPNQLKINNPTEKRANDSFEKSQNKNYIANLTNN